MTTLTAKKVYDLNNMNAAAQRAQLGTLLMGGAVIPAVGTLSTVNTLRYNTTPAVKSATATHAAIALTSGAQTGYATALVQPDVPRTMTVKGNASGITGNVVYHGTDIAGTAVTDTIALSGSSEVLGVVAFKTVTSVDLPAETHAGTDTVSLGRGAGIGFPSIINNTADVITHDFDNASDSGTIVADATLGKSVYIVAGTMDGAKVVSLTYEV
jgi:hypothetical protein